MKQQYVFGTAQGISERAAFLVSLAGPRGGSMASFGLDRDQAEELRDNLNKALGAVTPPTRVLVATEGGTVQGAVADRPGVSVIVLDYDTEGADADRVFAIPQDSGGTAEAFVGGHSAVHDPAFIDGAEAADLADPEEALEQLRDEVKAWATDHPAMAETSRLAAEELEARLPELLERKAARELAEAERAEQFRADFAARVAARETATA